LKAAILTTYKDQPVIGEVVKATTKLDDILKVFDDDLIVVMDDLLNANDDTQRKSLHIKARNTLARYQQSLKSDKLVAQLDDNPFVSIAVHKTLSDAVNTMTTKFA
jgi:hypothetical protein